MKKKSLIISSALLLTALLPAVSEDVVNSIDEIAWVVGDEAILRSDIEVMRLQGEQEGIDWGGDPNCRIPEQIAVQKLFLNQAVIDSVEVADADVFQEVDRRINAMVMNFGSKEKMEEYLGKTTTQIREQWFDLVKENEIMEQVKRDLVKNIKVTPAQVRRYFKEQPEDSIPFVPTKVECQIITREPVIPQTEIDRVKNELLNYRKSKNNSKSKRKN